MFYNDLCVSFGERFIGLRTIWTCIGDDNAKCRIGPARVTKVEVKFSIKLNYALYDVMTPFRDYMAFVPT